MECNQEQGFTACGVDQLLVVCSFDQVSKSGCLHDSGPCHHGLSRDGYVGECQGRSQYAAHLPKEKFTRSSRHYEQAREALSIAVKALCTMTYNRYDNRGKRDVLFGVTLKKIREAAGDIRLTTMKVSCAWCEKPMGEKEGDGSVGESSTICPSCLGEQLAKLPEEARKVAAAIGRSLAPAKVSADELSPQDRSELEAYQRGVGPQTRETAKVAAPAVSR